MNIVEGLERGVETREEDAAAAAAEVQAGVCNIREVERKGEPLYFVRNVLGERSQGNGQQVGRSDREEEEGIAASKDKENEEQTKKRTEEGRHTNSLRR